jgi:hypothetical protein
VSELEGAAKCAAWIDGAVTMTATAVEYHRRSSHRNRESELEGLHDAMVFLRRHDLSRDPIAAAKFGVTF